MLQNEVLTPLSGGDTGTTFWYVGVICALVASFAGALGDCLIKLSFLQEAKRSNGVRQIYKRPVWIFGTICNTVVNPVLTLVSLRFAAASTVTPFAGMHIFWSVFLARCILKELFHIMDIIACICIIIGITLIIIFGSPHNEYTADVLVGHIGWIVYAAVCGGFLVVCSILALPLRCIRRNVSSMLRQIGTTAIPGITGGNTNVCAKGAIMIISSIVMGNKHLTKRPALYILSILTICLAIVQIVSLNYALYKYRATFVIPVVNTVLIVTGALGAIIMFGERPQHLPFFTLGVTLVIIGIYTIAHSPSHAGGDSLYKGSSLDGNPVEDMSLSHLKETLSANSHDSHDSPYVSTPSTAPTQLLP